MFKEPKSPCNFFIILIFNELIKFKTTDEWQHWKTGSPTLLVEVVSEMDGWKQKTKETGQMP